MEITLKILLILLGFVLLPAQNQADTLVDWKAKFETLGGLPKLSPDGKWITINKFSRSFSDSTFIVPVQGGKNPYKIIGSPNFLNEQLVLGKKQDKVEVLNLHKGTKVQYNNIRDLYFLKTMNRYALLTDAKTIILFDANGQKSELDHIEGFGINKGNKLFVLRKNEDIWELWDLGAKHMRPIYSTVNAIRRTDLSISADKLFITESVKGKPHDLLTIIDIQKDRTVKVIIPKMADIVFTEIQHGSFYLINARIKYRENPDPLVEVWYGNDAFLGKDKPYYKTKDQKYWLYTTDKHTIKEIHTPKNAEIKALNNERYFISYMSRKNFNYLTSNLSPEDLNDATIYDLENKSLAPIGNLKSMRRLSRREVYKPIYDQIIASPDGSKFLASRDGKKWSIFTSDGKLETTIDRVGLELPVFSGKGDNIYFESADDLWTFSIKMKELKPMNIAHGQVTRIKNDIYKNDNRILSSSMREPFLIEGYDLEKNTTSYYIVEKGRSRTIVPTTKNRINHIVFDESFKNFYTLEENFNRPPVLRHYVYGKPARTIFDGEIKDKQATKIKQEIITFNAVGKKLTGILYYPINFDSHKKYPMVVHIYQRQRQESNEYLSPNNEFPVGFQIRTLIERGYFVFLPDILYNDSGTGLSALACVDSALDAVLKNVNIDRKKVGLGGHSHGGYETNFIATHSDRFATYVSGAGNSDLIRSYYSYNYNFISPFYWQFESEQYALGKSFAEDKSLYLKNSPILNVEKVNAPVLLWAGKKDENIQWDQVMEFFIGLKRYQKDVIALFYPDQSHAFFNGTKAEIDLGQRILDWWDYHLKGSSEVSWINQMKKDAE